MNKIHRKKKSYQYLEIVLLSIVKDYFFPCSLDRFWVQWEQNIVDVARITRLILTLHNRLYPPQESLQTLCFCEIQWWIKRLLTAVIYIIYLSCVAKKCIQIRLFKHFFAQSSIVSINYIALAELILHQLNTFMLLWQCPQSILAWSFHCRQGVWALLAFLRVHCAVDGFCDILWNTSLCLKKRWLQWPLADLSPFLECYSASKSSFTCMDETQKNTILVLHLTGNWTPSWEGWKVPG